MSRTYQVIFILSVLYIVGVVGVLLPIHPDFLLLTPVNLLLSLVLVLMVHRGWSKRTVIFLALCYLVGFGAELFGVQTGLLFGEYRYGAVLGPKVWDTPLMIGINWVLVCYCAGVTVNHLAGSRSWWVRALSGALLMVALDVLIEPVAMRRDFWSWSGHVVPLKNYVGWFAVSLPLQALFARWLGKIRNNAGVALFMLQVLFFLILGLWNHN